MAQLRTGESTSTKRRALIARWGIPSLLAMIALIGAIPVHAKTATPSTISGLSNRSGSSGNGCGGCHSPNQDLAVTINGPTLLNRGQQGTFTVSAGLNAIGSGKNMGVIIAAGDSGDTLSGSAPLTYLSGSRELIHNSSLGSLAQTGNNGYTSYSFKYTMPSNASFGSSHKLFAVSRIDTHWNFATGDSGYSVTTSTPAPNITSSGSKTGQVGEALTYQIGVSSGNSIQPPTSYGASNRPAGISINTSTGLLSGTPTAATNGTPVVTVISAANSADTDSKNLSFTIAKGDQTITFGSQTNPTFSPGGTFTLNAADTNPTAAPSPQYTSLDTNKCTMVSATGTTVNIIEGGTCRVKASQPGNNDWNAADPLAGITKTITINKANQSISFPLQASRGFVANGTFTITDDASATSGLNITYTSLDSSVCTMPGTTSKTVTMIDIGTCPIQAAQTGNVNYLGATAVVRDIQITETPGAPTLTAAHKGNGRATLEFTGPNNASSVQYYTGTCNATGQTTRTATSATPSTPIVVTGLVNGATYVCRITATNSTGTGLESNFLFVVPDAPPPNVVPELRAAFSIGFVIGKNSSYTIVSTGTPTPAVTRGGAALPSGITFATGGSIVTGTATLSGIAAPGPGAVGIYVVSLAATNSAGSDSENILVAVDKGKPVITFNALADRVYSPTPFSISGTIATPDSILSASNIVFTPGSPSICSVSGTTVTMLAVGVCTIHANSTTNATYTASYNAAPQVTRSFDVDFAPQTITFNAQPTPRTFASGATFPISPLATVNSPLTIAYASLSRRVCTVSGNTVTMVGGGTCMIEASQDGNALYAPATDVVQNVVINPAAQSISFGAQAAQPFVEGGSFAINPVATATSGQLVSYASLSPAVCTLLPASPTVPNVLIVATGTCTLQATQAGNANYGAATPVSQNVAINAVPPGAPTLDVAIPSDGKVLLSLIAPGANGGAPVTGYVATCTPGPLQGTSGSTTITVSGLTNGQAYSCSVVAQNAAGNSAPSNAITGIMPFLDTGANLWTSKCSGCHDTTPSAARFNAAGETGTVLNYVRLNQASMVADSAVQALTANELSEIAKYIKSFVPAISVTTDYVTPKMIDVGLPNHLYLGGVAFTDAEVVTPAANGTLSAFNGTQITYTPNPGFAGADSITYRGKRSSPSLLLGEARTVTIMVNTPAAPVITSQNAANGVFGQSFSYQITATNSPASFGATSLPSGTSVSPTGLIFGTATAGGLFNTTVSATNPGGTGNLLVPITISKANQSITSFGAQANQSFAIGSFAINPLAVTSSGLTATYSSSTSSVCTVSGTTVTVVSAGLCTLVANQSGDDNYNGAIPVNQSLTITASLPGAPTLTSATPGNDIATLAFAAPANTGGTAISNYTATCTPSGSGGNTISPIVVSGLTNGTQYSCQVRAVNSAGNGPLSNTVLVTPQNANVPPQFTSANATSFTVLSLGTFTVTASGTPAPVLSLISGTPPTGVSFTPGTGVLTGIPAAGTAVGSPYVLVFRADGTNPDVDQNFTLTVAKQNQAITFNNPGPQNFSVSSIPIVPPSAVLPVTLISTTPSVCTVSGNNLTTVTIGTCTLNASQAGNADVNAANSVSHTFQINPATQSITFGAQTTPRSFSTTPFVIAPTATTTSGLGIVYSSATPSVCSVSGINVTMLTAGLCSIAANQPGNANYNAANQVTQNVTINAVAPGAPTIGAATGSDLQASIAFTAPASNGGSPITQYTATCSPSGSGSASVSPITVTGLTNGQSYSCSVTATNQAGLTSVASGSVNVTPSSANGAALWTSVCGACHSQTPSGNQLNGAGSTATVLQHVRTTQPLMAIFSTVQNLTQADLAAIAVYVRDQLPTSNPSTPQNTAVPINVASHVTFTNQVWSAFTSVEVVSPPANGALTAFTGTTATYTPNNGYVGTDSFTYRGKRSAPDVAGDPITVTINVLPGAPVITSPLTATATFNAPFSYPITATGTPTSFGATGLPNGFSINAAGEISGTPDATGLFNVMISATNAGGTTQANLAITVNPAAQTITFPPQTNPSRNYAFNGSFAIDPLAAPGASGQPVTYGSASPGVCSASGTTLNIIAAGACTITANQAGNANYAAATQVTRAVTINAVLPNAPTIGNATPGNMSALIAFTAPANTGGAAITGYTVSCLPSGSGGGTASPITVTGLTNGVPYACSVTASNSAGPGAASQTVNVTPQQITVPDAPVIGIPTGLNAAASIAFSPPANNGGSAILNYTATCNPGAFSNNGATSPIMVSGLTNGATYTCSVIAANAIGPSAPSASLDVTPIAPIAFTGAKSRKLHGATPYDLPILNVASIDVVPLTVEPRAVGSGHKIIFDFTDVINVVNDAIVTDELGAPVTGIATTTVRIGSAVEVTITGLADNRRIGVALFNVNGTGLIAKAYLGFLVGDVTQSKGVNAADIAAIKARIGQPIATGSNYLFDVNLNGAISNVDASQAKARSGLAIP